MRIEKKLVFFALVLLVFSSIGFAPIEETYERNDVTLYTIWTPPSMDRFRATTDIDFDYSTRASTSAADHISGGGPSDIGNNAILCPNADVSVGNIISGTWASPDFYARVDYFYSCTPPGQGTTHNKAIRWSEDNYENYIDRLSCSPGDSCWNHGGTLHNQRVNYYEMFSEDDVHRDKRGKMTMICKGRNRIRLYQRDGGSWDQVGLTTYQDTDGSTYFSHTFNNLHEGEYQLRTRFEVEGCEVLIRIPECEGAETEVVYSRTQAQSGSGAPEYSYNTNPQQILNFDVQDIELEATPGASIPPTGSSTCVDAGESVYIEIPVTNTGDVDLHVSDVEAGGGFEATPIPEGCAGFICTFNGFGNIIPPGGMTITKIFLQAPEDYEGSHLIMLSYMYESDGDACGESSRVFNRYFRINESSTCITPTRCEIEPAEAIIEENTVGSFELNCFEDDEPASCSGVVWTLEGLAHTLQNPTNEGVDVLMESEDDTGTLIAEGMVGDEEVVCRAEVTAIPWTFDGCILAPEDSTLDVDALQSFTISCFEDGDPEDCEGVDWAPADNLEATILLQTDEQALMRFGAGDQTGNLVATVTTPDYSCEANITTNPDEELPPPVECILDPDNIMLEPESEQTFNIICLEDGEEIEEGCEGVDWNVDASLDPTILMQTDDDALIRFDAENVTGELTASVGTPEVSCISNIGILEIGELCPDGSEPPCPGGLVCPDGTPLPCEDDEICPDGSEPPCEPTDQSCRLSPSSWPLEVGTLKAFTLTCDEATDGRCGTFSADTEDHDIARIWDEGTNLETGQAQFIVEALEEGTTFLVVHTENEIGEEFQCHAEILVGPLYCVEVV